MSAQGVKKRIGSRRQVKSKSPELDEMTGEQHSASTEGAEDVPEFSSNRRKLGSSRKNKRLHPVKDLGVLDGATRNAMEDDPLDTAQVLSTEEVKIAHEIPEEPHRTSELNNRRHEGDEKGAVLTHESFQDNCVVFEPRVIAEDAELRAETKPNEELEVNLSQPGGAVQTFDPTEVCDKESNTKPEETEESQRKRGLEEHTEPLSQPNHEHKEAESICTEEAPETPHWFVATGTVEKESEDLNLETNQLEPEPDPDPEPSIPKHANLPEDLHERGGDSAVELSDDEGEEGALHQPGPALKGLASLETVAKVIQDESADMHGVSSASVSCDVAPASSPFLQHVPQAKTDQSESSDGGNDAPGAGEPRNTAVGQDCEADAPVDEVKFSSAQLHHEHKDLLSEPEQSCSSQALQPERGSCRDPQPQESEACLSLIEHRRKLGSSRRHKGGQLAVDSESEPLSQSNPEHREAEPSGSGTEETPETTHWFVATGTVEKEPELTCEDKILSEPPESFLSGSPPELQNLNTSHPEPVPEPSIPKPANLPEDLHERGADSAVELSDDEEGATPLMQQMNERSSSEGELSAKTQSEAASLLDCDLQEDVRTAGDTALNYSGNIRKLGSSRRPKHVQDSLGGTFNGPKVERAETTAGGGDVESIAASTARMATVSKEIPDLQPAQKMNPDVSEGECLQEDTDLSQNVKANDNPVMTGSDSDGWRTTHPHRAAAGSLPLEGFTLEAPHVVQKDQDSPQRNPVQHTHDAKEGVGEPGGEGSAREAQEKSPPPEPTNAESTSSDPSPPLCSQGSISTDLAADEPGERRPGGHLEGSPRFQEQSKQRRRKMGSTRWSHTNPEHQQVGRAAVRESSSGAQAGGGRRERAAEASWEPKLETSAALLQAGADVTSDPQSTHSNPSSPPPFEACAAGRSASDSEQGVNPTIIVGGSDFWDGGSNTGVSLEPSTSPSHTDDFPAAAAQTSSCLLKASPCPPPCSTPEQPQQSAGQATAGLETVRAELEADDERKDPPDPDKVAEGGYFKDLEPDLNTEDFPHQQRAENERVDKRREDSSSERGQGPVKGLRLPGAATLQPSEEAPAASESHRPPTTSPENDLTADKLSGRRRRKLGSHRKSSRPQSQETQTGSDVSSAAEEPTAKTGAEDKPSEVDDGEKKSANTSSSEVGGPVNPVSSTSALSFAPRTLVPPLVPGSCLSPENQSLSLAGRPGAEEAKSNRYNVIMVGNSDVGKTSFMRRLLNGRFSSDLPSSVGLDMCLWPVLVDGKQVVLQLWDTVGQERFHSVTRQIFHKAHAFLLMYDITSSWSFRAVSYWANCIQEGATENVTILLLGNKNDCAEREVPAQEGEILAKEYAFEFMECSAATGQNVSKSLETVARILSNKVKLGEETTVLHKEARQKKSSGCC